MAVKRRSAGGSARAQAPRKRGDGTRERLLDAARFVFERDGYVGARVADIVAKAGLAHGSFYTYFDSKEDVFNAVAALVVEQVLDSLRSPGAGMDTKEKIRAANANFLRVYKEHARMLGLIDQVATLTEEFRRRRLDLYLEFVKRVSRAIDSMAESDPLVAELDSGIAASALGGMVDKFAYTQFVLGQEFDRDRALATLDAIWFRTLNL
jgi:AcrR family transcriptional regulator